MSNTSTPINLGSGANVGVDNVSGVLFQRVKLVNGNEGAGDGIPGDNDGLLVQLGALPEIDPRQDYANVAGAPKEIKWAKIDLSAASGDQIIIAASGVLKFRVLSLFFCGDTALHLALKSGVSNTLAGNIVVPAQVPVAMDPSRGYVCQTNAGEAFVLNFDAAVTGGGYVCYVEI